MTVSSLWKVLAQAGCGRHVGVEDILDPDRAAKKRTNPWNINDNRQNHKKRSPTLAVDLSIWICEGLTSQAMARQHTDPPVHLVFTRVTKLLSLGIKLVVVVEGKRRIRRSQPDGQDDKFHCRRSGTKFWKACRTCEEMVRLMGVPVVKAKAEGEALCALLNERGVVDGVISNDGDCLLFGAKTVYTRFSLESLRSSSIVRYEVPKLIPPGLEPGTLCVLGTRDNHYTTESMLKVSPWKSK